MKQKQNVDLNILMVSVASICFLPCLSCKDLEQVPHSYQTEQLFYVGSGTKDQMRPRQKTDQEAAELIHLHFCTK